MKGSTCEECGMHSPYMVPCCPSCGALLNLSLLRKRSRLSIGTDPSTWSATHKTDHDDVQRQLAKYGRATLPGGVVIRNIGSTSNGVANSRDSSDVFTALGCLGFLGLLGFMIFQTMNVQSSRAPEPAAVIEDSVRVPEYVHLGERVVENNVGHPNLVIKVAIEGPFNEKELRKLLLMIEGSSRRIYRSRSGAVPEVVEVFAYPTRAHAISDQWVGKVAIEGEGAEPVVEINSFMLARQGAPETSKSADDAKKHQVWIELCRAENRANRETDYGGPSAEALWTKYKQQVAKRHGITYARLKEIEREGLMNSWAIPAD